MWEKLWNIYIKVRERVVYLILQELLYYSATNKPKKYKKLIIEIFIEVQYLYKRLKEAMTKEKNLFEIMVIVIILNTIYDNYNIITVSTLEIRNNFINEIFTII